MISSYKKSIPADNDNHLNHLEPQVHRIGICSLLQQKAYQNYYEEIGYHRNQVNRGIRRFSLLLVVKSGSKLVSANEE